MASTRQKARLACLLCALALASGFVCPPPASAAPRGLRTTASQSKEQRLQLSHRCDGREEQRRAVGMAPWRKARETASSRGGPTRMALDDFLLDQLTSIDRTFNELTERLGDPDVLSNPKLIMDVSKERASVEEVVLSYAQYTKASEDLVLAKDFFNESSGADGDAEMKEMAREEMRDLEEQLETLETRIKLLLLPTDPNDDRNVMLEIRAGAGGDEAAIWAGELLGVYRKYALEQGWSMKIIDDTAAETGGFKTVIAEVNGEKVYSKLKYEAGVHRVQRVPATETQGRVHTSTATVAIMPEVDDVAVEIKAEDIELKTARSGGAGGQNVNKVTPGVRAKRNFNRCICSHDRERNPEVFTFIFLAQNLLLILPRFCFSFCGHHDRGGCDSFFPGQVESAVDLIHKPTGIRIFCTQERSQLKNRDLAMKLLRSKLYDIELEKQLSETSGNRRAQVGSGARSEKIRTYNWKDNRCSDHRIGKNFPLPTFLSGSGLDDMIGACILVDQQELMAEMALKQRQGQESGATNR
eukprot:jgi/Undpi1/8748/HiC_scaffold_25.g11210.m1